MLNLKSKIPQIVLVLVGLLYLGLLAKNLNESKRRSLHLHADARAADNVRVPMRILSADLNNGDVRVAMGFEVRGNIAIDAATPAVDLKLLLNTSRGPQEVDFPKGRRMNPVEAVFNTTGDVDGYPFDQHAASLGVKMVTPRRPDRPPAMGGSSAPEQYTSVPVEVDLSASIPGVKFQGRSKMGTSEIGFLGDDQVVITLYMRRADNVIATSIFVTVLMLGLGTGVLAMVLEVTVKGKESPLLPLSLSVSLIFGLPALRALQPNVPPLGVLCDYFGYVWAELIVAASTIAVVWTWHFRSRAKAAAETHKPETPK